MKPIKRIMDHALGTATDQEVFDYIAAHLLRQNKPSVEEGGGSCLYRGPEGLKCAVGACLSDELIDNGTRGDPELLEGEDVYGAARILCIPMEGERADLLQALQGVHDGEDADEWVWRLERLAKRHNLEFDEERLKNAELVDA